MPLTPPVPPQSYYPTDQTSPITQIYVVYDVRRTVSHHGGCIPMPGAGPDGTEQVLIKTHGAYEIHHVIFTIACDGSIPEIPAAESLLVDPNYQLLGFVFGGIIAQPRTDGTVRYTVSGTYNYALKRPDGLSKGFNLGAFPWEGNQYLSEYIPATKFKNNVLNPTPIVPPVVILPPPIPQP